LAFFTFYSPNKQNAQIKGNQYFPAQNMPVTKTNRAKWLELFHATSLTLSNGEKL
jgi:hypothetical protein